MLDIVKRMNLLILPVGANCNQKCVYCYHDGIEKCNPMPYSILDKIIKESFSLFSALNFIWHGGEPLLAGLPFFKKAVDLQNNYCCQKLSYKNIIQTNATLIDNEWADFFNKNKFFVSTSIDGFAFAHNQNRKTILGKGSFAQVVRGINRVKRNQKIGIITIINKTNVNYPEKVYETMKKIGNRGFKIHFFSETSKELKKLVPDEKSVVNFLKTIFDLWIKEDNPSFQIRTFTDMVRAYLGAKVVNCAAGKDRCKFFMTVVPNGDIYSCHRFIKCDDFRLGNILEKPLKEILDQGISVYQQMSQLPKECLKCKWIEWCGGDCSYDRWLKNKNFNDLSPNCRIFKEIFGYVEKRLKTILN